MTNYLPALREDLGPLTVLIIETPNLGDRSYVVTDGRAAVVVDPQRDIDRVLEAVEHERWTITHVLETHIHNDYVSGGLELARVVGAEYVVPGLASLSFAATPAHDGDTFVSGAMTWRVLHTPGHTPHHVSFTVAVDGSDIAVFTGGSLLFGSVGRPDLLGPVHTLGLAHDQWRSARLIGDSVAGNAAVLPTHGFGSFCSATETVGTASTVAEQRRTNPVFAIDEQRYVDDLLAGLDSYPAYYAHMGPANSAGPGPIDLSLPQRASAAELRTRIEAGEWVVDLRSRRLFAQGHLKGTLSFDVAGNAVTYLGWLIPWGTPLTLIGSSVEQVALMQRELVRIGIDRPVAYSDADLAGWLSPDESPASFATADFAMLGEAVQRGEASIIVDLRRRSEWQASHVASARHIPLHDLPNNLGLVRTWAAEAAHAGRDSRIWIYCGSGFRAAVGASLLERADLEVVHIDQDFAQARLSGITMSDDERPDRLGPSTTA